MIIQGRIKTMLLVIVGLGVNFTQSGCSISDSAGSISDSSGSIAKSSESISDSSTGNKQASETPSKKLDYRYESEVQDFTVTYLRTNANRVDQSSFMKGISDIASDSGIVDWEANPKTYRAIGKGLKKSHKYGIQYEYYKKKFGDSDPGKMDDIQEGYNSKN